MFHAFLGEKLPDWKAAATLVRKIAENYKLPYYTLSPTYSVCKDHGYISGEKYVCPICGAKTEVYSRITGYYRPVQNWNDGKTQEYKDRVTYNIGTSVMKRSGVPDDSETVDSALADDGAQIMLFATKTCPKCKVAASMLDKAGVEYTKLYVEDNEDLARELGLKQAPTIVAGSRKYAEIAGVKSFIEEMSAVKAK